MKLLGMLIVVYIFTIDLQVFWYQYFVLNYPLRDAKRRWRERRGWFRLFTPRESINQLISCYKTLSDEDLDRQLILIAVYERTESKLQMLIDIFFKFVFPFFTFVFLALLSFGTNLISLVGKDASMQDRVEKMTRNLAHSFRVFFPDVVAYTLSYLAVFLIFTLLNVLCHSGRKEILALHKESILSVLNHRKG